MTVSLPDAQAPDLPLPHPILLISHHNYQIYLAPPWPSGKPSHSGAHLFSPWLPHTYLSDDDLSWLSSCTHPLRRMQFLRGRWCAFALSNGTTRLVRLAHGAPSYRSNYGPRKTTHGACRKKPGKTTGLISAQTLISISHRDDDVIVGITSAHPNQGRHPRLFGIDMERASVSEPLAKKILPPHILDHPNLTLSRAGAVAFSAREALWKSWGSLPHPPPPLSSLILTELAPLRPGDNSLIPIYAPEHTSYQACHHGDLNHDLTGAASDHRAIIKSTATQNTTRRHPHAPQDHYLCSFSLSSDPLSTSTPPPPAPETYQVMSLALPRHQDLPTSQDHQYILSVMVS